jgi:hypothetical protein
VVAFGDGELDEVAAAIDLVCRKLDLARFSQLARIAEEIEQDLPQRHWSTVCNVFDARGRTDREQAKGNWKPCLGGIGYLAANFVDG